MDKSLTGIKEITTYTRRSWNTIQIWIVNDGFPARKMDGIWESMPELIDKWKLEKLSETQTT